MPFYFLPHLSPSLCPGVRPYLLRPPLWCGGWQALLWSLVDEWVSSSSGVQNGCCVVSCRQQLKYIVKDVYMTAPCHRSPTGRQVAANLVDLCKLQTAEDADCAEHFCSASLIHAYQYPPPHAHLDVLLFQNGSVAQCQTEKKQVREK